MPAADVVLLPLCVGLTLIGVVATILVARRGSRGRVVQAIGWTLAPVALYFSGLLTLVWNGITAVVGWAGRLVFSPPVWVGLSLLALAIVLIGVGGVVARRHPGRRAIRAEKAAGRPKAVSGKSQPAKATGKAPAAADDDMDEIEAILRNRGIN